MQRSERISKKFVTQHPKIRFILKNNILSIDSYNDMADLNEYIRRMCDIEKRTFFYIKKIFVYRHGILLKIIDKGYCIENLDASATHEINWNSIERLPQSIRMLNISNTKIKLIPRSVAAFKKLKALDVSYNNCLNLEKNKLPQSLEIIDLTDCFLLKLPSYIF